MIFSSAIFLVYFLPFALIFYWLTPAKFKNTTALLLSFLFYIWGAPSFVPFLVLSIIVDFFIGRRLSRTEDRNALLIASLVLNLGLLFFFKYFGFFGSNLGFQVSDILLPLGISFFTFQKISYIVDIYQRKNKPFNTIADFALYILFFPQLIAGPIVRYAEIKDQIENHFSRFSFDSVLHGFFRFSLGLAKKVLIADQLSEVADKVFSLAPEALTIGQAWLGALAYAFQIYFDFSGYTDMALGIALMMGFRLPENFNFPYISRNFTEFWQRWHITLSAWMRDYLYIPLGGNRKSKVRVYVNLWIVFILSGLWHGAEWQFIAWGVFNGCFLVFDRITNWKMGIVPTFIFLLIGWVLFRADSLQHAADYFLSMFDLASAGNLLALPGYLKVRHIAVLSLAFLLCFTPVLARVRVYASTLVLAKPQNSTSLTMRSLLAIILFLLSLTVVLSSDVQSFIYFRF